MKAFLPILFILISVLSFIFFVNPNYKEVKDIRANIELYNKGLTDAKNLQKIQNDLLSSYNEIKEIDKDRLNSFLPNSVNNIQLILEIERIANKYAMPISDIKFQAVRDEKIGADSKIIVSNKDDDNKLYRVFPIEFTTEGSYKNFNLFIADLEQNLRLVDLKAISFTSPDSNKNDKNQTNTNIYKFNLKAETYWLK